MAERIISALDARDGGYLKTSLEDLLPPDAGPEQLELARQALEIVQSLDPPGIAARDLRECLLLQLTPDMPYYDELKTLISGHLEDLRDNRLPQIERKTGYSIERIQEAWEQLRKLNPKPGADVCRLRGAHRHARCDAGTRRTTGPIRWCWKMPARRGCSSATTIASG